MSLTIPPQGFAAGFSPKTYPIVSPQKEASSDSKVNIHPTNPDIKVDLSHLEVIIIIPEGDTDGDNNISSDGSLMNSKTVFNINTNSNELVEKIIDPETGGEIRETPDTN